jgi:hypothetical protein
VGFERPVSGVILPFQRAKFDSGGRPCPAMTCRWIFYSNAAIHFVQRSGAAIGLRVINFSV